MVVDIIGVLKRYSSGAVGEMLNAFFDNKTRFVLSKVDDGRKMILGDSGLTSEKTPEYQSLLVVRPKEKSSVLIEEFSVETGMLDKTVELNLEDFVAFREKRKTKKEE